MGRATQYLLPNGVRWIHECDWSASGIHLHYGSLMGAEKEIACDLGASHLVEHLLSCGETPAATRDLELRLAKRKIRTNGGVTYNVCYGYLKGPAKHAKQIFDHAFYGLTYELSPVELEREKRVISKELRVIVSDSITTQLGEQMRKHLYEGTRYGRICEDDLANLSHITMAKVHRTRARLLRASNLGVVTISRMEDKRVQPLVERVFGSLPCARSLQQYEAPLPEPKPFRAVYRHNGAELSYVQHTFRCGPPSLETEAVLRVIGSVLGGNSEDATALLRQSMRGVAGDTYLPWVHIEQLRPEVLFHIYYMCDPGEVERNSKIVFQTLEQLCSQRIPESDLRRFRSLAVEGFDWDIANAEDRGEWYLTNAAFGLHTTLYDFRKHIRAVTGTQLRKTVREHFGAPGTVVFNPNPRSKRLKLLELMYGGPSGPQSL